MAMVLPSAGDITLTWFEPATIVYSPGANVFPLTVNGKGTLARTPPTCARADPAQSPIPARRLAVIKLWIFIGPPFDRDFGGRPKPIRPHRFPASRGTFAQSPPPQQWRSSDLSQEQM